MLLTTNLLLVPQWEVQVLRLPIIHAVAHAPRHYPRHPRVISANLAEPEILTHRSRLTDEYGSMI